MALTIGTTTFARGVDFVTAIGGGSDRSFVRVLSSDGEALTSTPVFVTENHLPVQVGWLLSGRFRNSGSPTLTMIEYPFLGSAPTINQIAVTVQDSAVALVVSLTAFASVDGTFYAFVNGIDPNARVDAISSDGISVQARRAHTYDSGRRNAGIVLTGKLRFGGSPTFSLIVRTPPLGTVTLASVSLSGGVVAFWSDPFWSRTPFWSAAA